MAPRTQPQAKAPLENTPITVLNRAVWDAVSGASLVCNRERGIERRSGRLPTQM